MTRYSYDSLTLLCRLIHRDNPDLKQTLSAKNIMVLGGPYTNGLGTSGRNTRLKLNGRTGSGIVGKAEFYYDRLNIGAMFNGITVVFEAEGKSATVADLLPALNEQYGLGLTNDDLSNGATKLGTGYTATPVALTISPTSVAFTGTLNVIWTRRPVGVFPDSGPGPKTMLSGGLEEGGYFGRVSAAEMPDSAKIFNELLAKGNDGISTPYVQQELYWLKFAYKGNYLFFPSKPLASTSWQNLYERGAVYGDGTTGKFPPAGSPLTEQNTILTFEGAEGLVGFIPRLPTFHETDPAPAERSPNGEMGKLLWRVFTGTYSYGDWDTLATGTGAGLFDITTNIMWQNSRAAEDGTTEAAWVTSPSAAATGGTAKKSAYAWRPFLQLTDLANATLPLIDITSQVVGRIRAPLLSIDTSRDPAMLVRLEDVQGQYTIPFERIRNYDVTSNPMKTLTAIHAEQTVRGFGFVSETIRREPFNLSTANGELDGF